MTVLPDDPEEFVTVKEFIEPVEAQMAKSVLESAGVECFLLGENTNSLLSAAFYAQLQVHKKDEADALAILDAPGEVDEGEIDEQVDGND